MTEQAYRRSWDIVIPLNDGYQAGLRLPIPLTPAEYNTILDTIRMNLEMCKGMVVAPEPTPSSPQD